MCIHSILNTVSLNIRVLKPHIYLDTDLKAARFYNEKISVFFLFSFLVSTYIFYQMELKIHLTLLLNKCLTSIFHSSTMMQVFQLYTNSDLIGNVFMNGLCE